MGPVGLELLRQPVCFVHRSPSLADAAFESFESVFCNNMVLVLDSYFVHRGRAIEGKDGNPLNEVRILCHSMTHNNETMASDTSINMNPAKSVLKYRVGDQIRLSEQDFLLIAKAFFAEIESKFATVS